MDGSARPFYDFFVRTVGLNLAASSSKRQALYMTPRFLSLDNMLTGHKPNSNIETMSSDTMMAAEGNDCQQEAGRDGPDKVHLIAKARKRHRSSY